MRTDTKTHTDISVIDNSTDITVYAPDPQIRQNYDAFVKYVRNLELKMRGYNTNEDAGPKPIASYRAAGKTNEDADREDWCLSHGIVVPKEARRSLDGTKVVLHEEFINPIIRNSEEIDSYLWDSSELMNILDSSEWVNKEDYYDI